MTASIEQAFSIQEVCDAWKGLSPDHVRKLMRTGQIGFIKTGRSRSLLPEHIAQLRAVIEVKPREPEVSTVATRIGQTSRSAAIRARRAS